MEDTNASTEFRTEGDPAFPVSDKENDNSSSSSEGEENTGDQTDSSTEEGKGKEGEGNKDTESKSKEGFQDHPRWKQREEDWKTRFNDQETRHTDAITKIREDFGEDQRDNAKETKIPSWFGGNQEAWNSYRADRETEIKEAEERVIKRFEGVQTKKDEAVKKAQEYMQTEMTAIEFDKDLNPDGTKVDANKLLKFVLDNDLVDSKGRWNYRAGFRMMTATGGKATKDTKGRKKMAGATTSESKAESEPTSYKTNKDFVGNKRPW